MRILFKTQQMRVFLMICLGFLIIEGHWISKGALFGGAFIGLANGPILALLHIFHNEGSYSLMLFGPIFLTVSAICILGGTLACFIGSIYIAIRKKLPVLAAKITSVLLGCLSALTFIGLLWARKLPSYDDWKGDPHIETFFFFWPLCFALFSVTYAKIATTSAPAPTTAS